MNEKRRYFRIEDSIGLALRSVASHKPDLKLSDTETELDQELRLVETELNSLVNTIWGEDPKIAKSIGLLNRKLEILSEKRTPAGFQRTNNFDVRYHNLPVSLSASGLAFESDNSLPVDDRLELMLLLAPANVRVVVKGQVIESRVSEVDPSKYQIRIGFDLSPAEEEMLIQLIVQRQVQLIAKSNSL